MSFLFIQDEEKNKEKKNIMISEVEIKQAFNKLSQNYGKELAALVEKLFRLETRNFKSYVFKNTFGAGLLWNEKYFSNKPKFCVYVKPIYKNGIFEGNKIVSENEPGAKKYCYVVFSNIYEGIKYVADYLLKHKKENDFLPALRRWGGFPEYPDKVLKIKNIFVI
jgi:hypothetical protein